MSEEKQSKRERWIEEFPELAEHIESACAKHGEDEIAVLALTKPVGAVAIFRTPTGAEYSRFTSSILDDRAATKAAAAGILARSCVVHPAKQVFGEWLDRYGGIGSAVLKPLTLLAGAELSERGKE